MGLSTLGFPFPAPTGIVDYALRAPGQEASASVYASLDEWGGASLELDTVLPLGPTLSLAGGVAGYSNEFYNGTNSLQHVEGVTLRWTPSPTLEVQPFWQRSDVYDDEIGGWYIPSGPVLPPRLPRRRTLGPDWVEYEGSATLYGVKAVANPAERLTLRAGLFRSFFNDRIAATNLYTNIQPDRSARQRIVVDPPGEFAFTSGELRATYAVPDGPRVHILHASLRGQQRERVYGGSDVIDLGPTTIDTPMNTRKPVYNFDERSRDRVRQSTAGLAYEGRWSGVGELSLGVQRTDYRKRVDLPGLTEAETSSRPWLFNVTAAAFLSEQLAIYGGYVRGLEESGTAPGNAANRNEPLPAIRTRQVDGGVRWAITPDLKLVAGAFEISKPYFQLDEANVFMLLGDVRNRGAEFSLSGKLTPRLNIVAGAVLLDPKVTGEGVRLGRVGERPVGLPTRTLRFNADWKPPFAQRLSLDLGVSHSSRRPSTRDNRVFIPDRTLIDVGARYRTRLAGKPASLRIAVTNLFNVFGFEIISSGTYDLNAPRLATLSLATDF